MHVPGWCGHSKQNFLELDGPCRYIGCFQGAGSNRGTHAFFLRMAYIVISHRDEELGRQNLTSSLTVGRSPECDISWHDILLSRQHCRVEFFRGSWTLVDLGSKNGTLLNGIPITGRRVLKSLDEVTAGRIKIIFRSGVVGAGGRRKVRPADPWEAMEGTVSAFELDDSPTAPLPQRGGRPRPTPRPAPPARAATNVRALAASFVRSCLMNTIPPQLRSAPPIAPAPRPSSAKTLHPRPRKPTTSNPILTRPTGWHRPNPKSSRRPLMKRRGAHALPCQKGLSRRNWNFHNLIVLKRGCGRWWPNQHVVRRFPQSRLTCIRPSSIIMTSRLQSSIHPS